MHEINSNSSHLENKPSFAKSDYSDKHRWHCNIGNVEASPPMQ